MHCFFVYFFFFSSRRRHTRLVSDWSSDVCSSDLSMSKSQRDFFLREQIRAIQRELGEADPTTTEINALREQIEEIDLPEDADKVALKELDRLQQIPPTTPEYTVARNYLDWIVSLPWSKSTEDKIDLSTAAGIL